MKFTAEKVNELNTQRLAEVSWDESLYLKIGVWAKAVGLNWGGDWKSFKDKPHVEL